MESIFQADQKERIVKIVTKENQLMPVIGIHNDAFGICEEQEEEYERIKRYFSELTELTDAYYVWIETLSDLNKKDRPLDILVVDYGGLVAKGGLGASSLVDHYHDEIQKFAEEHPQTLIVFWSDMAVRDYADYIEEEVKDLGEQFVVMVPYFGSADDDEADAVKVAVERVKTHLGVC